MPSPIAHSTAGYLIYKISRRGYPSRISYGKVSRVPILLIISFGLSLLPDLDVIFGILFSDMGRFHNNGTHSLVVGLGVALVVGLIASWWGRPIGLAWFILVLMNYEGHILLDYFTYGRGVMFFWPISTERFAFPIALFYGFHWSDGLFSLKHVWTALSETLFVIVAVFISWLMERKMIAVGEGVSVEK